MMQNESEAIQNSETVIADSSMNAMNNDAKADKIASRNAKKEAKKAKKAAKKEAKKKKNDNKEETTVYIPKIEFVFPEKTDEQIIEVDHQRKIKLDKKYYERLTKTIFKVCQFYPKASARPQKFLTKDRLPSANIPLFREKPYRLPCREDTLRQPRAPQHSPLHLCRFAPA